MRVSAVEMCVCVPSTAETCPFEIPAHRHLFARQLDLSKRTIYLKQQAAALRINNGDIEAVRARTDSPISADAYTAGRMFWFTRKKFWGSYFFLMAAKRS